MRRQVGWLGTLIVALIAGGRGVCAEPAYCEPPQDCVLKRLAPAGGWCPYGGGLLHWWNPHCFPCGGAPDDYCPKPLPRVCWPPYPPYYIWGPSEVCYPPGCCRPANGESH